LKVAERPDLPIVTKVINANAFEQIAMIDTDKQRGFPIIINTGTGTVLLLFLFYEISKSWFARNFRTCFLLSFFLFTFL
jgi:hypothetical protein